jgi:hypothetical protein
MDDTYRKKGIKTGIRSEKPSPRLRRLGYNGAIEGLYRVSVSLARSDSAIRRDQGSVTTKSGGRWCLKRKHGFLTATA